MRRRHNPYFRKLLVGFDGSQPAERATEVAMELAECLDTEILLFAVARPPEPATLVELKAVLEGAREHYLEALEKIVRRASDRDLNVQTEIVVGHPAEQIIHRADLGGFSLILLGHRGKSRLRTLITGSTSERVLKYAQCPVMIVR